MKKEKKNISHLGGRETCKQQEQNNLQGKCNNYRSKYKIEGRRRVESNHSACENQRSFLEAVGCLRHDSLQP